MRTKRILILALLAAALPCVAAGAMLLGAAQLFGPDGVNPHVFRLRLFYIAFGASVGASLAVAGVILQAVLRNPLAEPYLLGISSGGGLGATIAIVANLTIFGVWTVPATAFVMALLTIFLVYQLARVGSRLPVHSLLLAGVVVGAVFGNILLLIVYNSSENNFFGVMGWMLGSLDAPRPGLLPITGAVTLAGVLFALLFARDLNLMLLGEEPAAHLGLRVERMKKLFFVVSSLITAAAVSSCGLIGFVGLIVPHIVRLVIGPDHRFLVPASALGGAIFLIAAHTVTRCVTGYTVPVGIVTALCGGPLFLLLLRRRRRAY